jgi:hypothetical protein
MKTCTKCKTEKPFGYFSKDKQKKDGLQCWCKECKKKYNQENKVRIAKKSKKYRSKHQEELINYCKEWRIKNPDYTKEYYRSNAEKIKKKSSRWKKENPEKVFNYNTKRRHFASHLGKEDWKHIMSQNDWKCFYCDTPLDKNNRTIDHIIALNNGGTNDIENCVASCMSCNCSKKDIEVTEWYKFKVLSANKQQYLLSILERPNMKKDF